MCSSDLTAEHTAFVMATDEKAAETEILKRFDTHGATVRDIFQIESAIARGTHLFLDGAFHVDKTNGGIDIGRLAVKYTAEEEMAAAEEVDDYFGLCPTCRKTDGFLNIGRSHWFYCAEHKVMWCFGVNIFSSWQHRTEEQQKAIFDKLGCEDFTEVEPYYLRSHNRGLRTLAEKNDQCR